MNVRKAVDYGTMHQELTAILAHNLPQMDEIHVIGKAISQRPEKSAAVAALCRQDIRCALVSSASMITTFSVQPIFIASRRSVWSFS